MFGNGGNSRHRSFAWNLVSGALLLGAALVLAPGSQNLCLARAERPNEVTVGKPRPPEAAVVVKGPETFLPRPVPLVALHDEQVLALAFSPDGKQLVTAGARQKLPGQLKVWDVATAKELLAEKGLAGVRTVAWSPEGQTVATGDVIGRIRLFDLGTRQWAELGGHSGGVNGLAFSADGTFLVSAGLDRTVRLWDVKERRQRRQFLGHTDMVLSVAFFRHGRAVVSCGRDRTAIVWDVVSGAKKVTLQGHRDGIEMVAVSPDDTVVATASWDKTVRLWDAETGKEQAVLPGETSFFAVAFSPKQKVLASAMGNGKMQFWDVAARQKLHSLEGHKGIVWALAFSPDGKRLASGSSDKTAKLWDVETGKEVTTLATGDPAIGPVLALACAPDGQALAIATLDQGVQLRDPRSGALLQRLARSGERVSCLAFSPDGQTLACGGTDRAIALWDRATGKERLTLDGPTGGANALAFSPDGTRLASAGDDRVVRIWDTRSGQEIASCKGHEAPIRALAYAGDGRSLASGGIDRTIKVWDLDKGTAAITLKGHEGSVRALAYAPDGLTLASASDDRTVKIWEPSRGTERFTLKGHSGEVWALAFSPGGRCLVSGGADLTVRAWGPVTGQSRGVFSKHEGPVTSLAFHPKTGDLFSGSQDRTVLRWIGASATEAIATREAERGSRPGLKGRLPESPLPEAYYQDFRGGGLPPVPWRLVGPDAGTVTRPEEGGVRITLPAQRKQTDAVGLLLPARIKGNFEITAGYEILQADKPTAGHGVGFQLSVATDTPTNEGLDLLRVARVDEGEVYVASHITTEDGKRQYRHGFTPTTAKAGYLRMTRSGIEATLWAAEGTAGAFRELGRYQLGAEDLTMVRLSAYPGHAPNAVDVLIKDLRVRTLGPAEAMTLAAAPADSPVTPRREGRRGWLTAGGLIALMLVLSFLGVWLCVRQRVRAEDGPPHASGPGEQTKSQAAPGSVACSCPGCGKNLRAKMDLAGKKIRCPQCKVALLVPIPKASQAAAPGRGKWLFRVAVVAALAITGTGLFSISVAVRRANQALNYLDRPLGVQVIPGIEEAGLLNPEVTEASGEPLRWTNGAAKLIVPLHDRLPQALNVRLGVFLPRTLRLRIQANDQPLFEEQVAMRSEWSRTFDLSGISLGKEIVIEVISDTFIPPEKDHRALGVYLRGITLIGGTKVYNNVPLGVRQLPEVPEEGFHEPQQDKEPYRWTDGSAKLTVPIRGKPPKALALGLGIPNQKGYRLHVTVNGQTLFDDEVKPNGRWSAELPLDGVNLGDRAIIELSSSTSVPAQINPETKDIRVLGVNVRRLLLVE